MSIFITYLPLDVNSRFDAVIDDVE